MFPCGCCNIFFHYILWVRIVGYVYHVLMFKTIIFQSLDSLCIYTAYRHNNESSLQPSLSPCAVLMPVETCRNIFWCQHYWLLVYKSIRIAYIITFFKTFFLSFSLFNPLINIFLSKYQSCGSYACRLIRPYRHQLLTFEVLQ